jgi:hypothetical protein
MISVAVKYYFRDKQMIRNTVVQGLALFLFLAVAAANSEISSLLEEDGYMRTLIILRGMSMLKCVSFITFAATWLFCSLLQIRHDQEEYRLMLTVGYTVGRTVMIETLKFLIQFIAAFVLACSMYSMVVFCINMLVAITAVGYDCKIIITAAEVLLIITAATIITEANMVRKTQRYNCADRQSSQKAAV